MEFTIRDASKKDVSTILDLAVASTIYGVSVLRDIPNHDVQVAVQDALADLRFWVSGYRSHRVFIAEESQSTTFAGYLILDLDHTEGTTGEQQSYIIDIAVAEHFWGTNVSNLLIRQAAKATHEAGLKYMVSDITASNRRSLVKAQRLGFQLERYQLTMHCGPDGSPLPMPGRPQHEQSHDFHRAQRRKRFRQKQYPPQES